MSIHVHAPRPTRVQRRILPCPVCERRRRTVVRHYEWYGATVTCCGCGDEWSDGELCPRPFERGWRQKAIKRARRVWNEARK